MKPLLLAAALVAMVPSGARAALPKDPLVSPMWEFIADQVFGESPVVRFDPRVKVRFPSIAENQRAFPVEVDARGVPDVVRVVIIADLTRSSYRSTSARSTPTRSWRRRSSSTSARRCAARCS